MSTELCNNQQGECAPAERTRNGVTYTPRIDIWENDEELVLYADLPGVAPEDLDIRFEDRELTLHAKVQPRQENVKFFNGEYGIGNFYRTFSIGETVDAEKISAQLSNGVLALHLPKVEAVKPRRIEVSSN